jgi:hypothetical protein
MALWAGCTGDLDPPSLVNKLRVLAVRAQVPNLAPNTQSFSDAYPGDLVMLDVLVAGIGGDLDGGVTSDQIDYLWLACTPPPGSTSVRDCAGSAAGMATSVPACQNQPGAAVCLLGTNASATYPTATDAVPMPSSIYVSVIVATRSSGGATGCLSRLAQDQAPGESCVVALKTLTIQPPDAQRNENPAVSTFIVNGSADIHSTPTLVIGKQLALSPSPMPSVSSEEKPGGQGEVLTYSWFATQKDFDHFHSGFSPQPPGENPDNTYTNQSEIPGRVHFWLVLRDDRGGVDWTDGFADFTMP